MVRRTSLTIISLIAFLIIHFISLNAYAQEIEVAQGTNITDPTNTGSTGMSVSIEVPPGRKGVSPKIALNYGSNGKNGWIGIGWDLNLGEIQRSSQMGINYSSNDYIFIGNGASSELISRPDWGTNYYGAKIEGAFSKYYYNVTTGGWEVTDKAGTKYYYGTTSASRQDNTYGTFRWLLDRVEDTNGNYMTVSYWKDQGEIYIDNVDYTGNTAGLNPTNNVKFYWESRSDIAPIYTTNSLVKTAYRLKTIDINASGQRSRTYVLTYTQSSSTSKSVLADVQMYGNDAILDANGTITGGSALPANQFTYSSESQGYFYYATWLNGFGNGNSSEYVTADFNGDGKYDIAYIDSAGFIYIATSTGGGFNTPAFWESFGSGNPSKYFFADFNGDGKTDAAYLTGQGYLYVALSTGYSFTTPTSWGGPIGNGEPSRYRLTDVNGDMASDIIYTDSSGNHYFLLSTGSSFTTPALLLSGFGNGDPFKYITSDFNGDGRIDFAYINNSNTYVAISNGVSFNTPSLWLDTSVSSISRFFFADFNGDNKADIAYLTSQGYFYVAVSTGSSFIAPVLWGGPLGNGEASRYKNADLNGDGISDIVYTDPSGNHYVLLSTGSAFTSSITWNTSWGNADPSRYRLSDFNGDGSSDMVYIGSDAKIDFMRVLWSMPNKLIEANNGIGGITSITYTSSSEYTNIMLPFVLPIVSSITNNDSNGNISTTNYTYSGGYFSKEERQFRGFSYQKSTDSAGTTTETWFYQDDIFKGRPYDQIVKDSNGNIYTRTYSFYDSISLYPGVNYTYLTQKDDYLYDGAQTYKQTAVSFEYDSYGNTTRKYLWGDVSVTGDERDEYTIYNYDTQNWMVSLPVHTYVTNSNGIVKSQTLFSYDSKGNLRTKTNWLNSSTSPITSYTYDAYGNPKTNTDAKNNITTISYDSTYTYPVAVVNALGHVGQIFYDLRIGKPIRRTDPNGNTTTFEYDVFGRLLESTDPSTSPSVYKWEESYYDGFKRTIKTKTAGPDNKIIVTQKTYNNRGLVSAESLPYFEGIETPRWTQYTYDPIGRVTQVTNPDNTTVKSSYMQGRNTIIDANNHVKVEEKDIYGRLVKVEEYTGTYPSVALYATTTYEYDILGNLLKTTDTKGNQITIAYDTLGRKTEMTDPDMGRWQYTYDANGNLALQTDAKGQTIIFTYDALNRVKTKHYPTGPDVVYTYDEVTSTNPIGKLTTVTDATGQEKYYYDQLGRTTKLIKTIDGIQYITENTYDSLGRTTSIKYPDNETVNYGYDAAGNLTQVSGYVTYSNFNALGQAATVTYANGVTTQYQYQTDNNRLYSITTNSPISGGLQNLAYTYDNTGNITIITDVMDNTRTQNFAYDDINRLTQAQSTSYGTLTYNYDQIGNMTYNSQLGTYTYGTKPHAVIQAGANTYTYDANGNMITRPGQTITYDYNNKPISINTTTFVYDHSGSRVKKNDTTYIGQIYECTNSNCTKYIFAGSDRIVSKTAATTYYYHTDHLGSSSIITDASGTKVQETYYKPYGDIAQNTGSVNLKHKYTGQEQDEETGLYYYGARYYDPALARFISADTIIPDPSDPQDFNRYTYVKNNPVIYVDPSGNSYDLTLYNGGTYNWSFSYDYGWGGGWGGWNNNPYAWFGGGGGGGNASPSPAPAYSPNAMQQQSSPQSFSSQVYNAPLSGGYNSSSIPRRNTGWYGEIKDILEDSAKKKILEGKTVDAFVDVLLSSAVDVFLPQSVYEVPLMFVPIGKVVGKIGTTVWKLGAHKSVTKWATQLAKRGWTEYQITEALQVGKHVPAKNMVNPANSATRYIHPKTGRSVVIDDVTNEVLHIGGDGFKY